MILSISLDTFSTQNSKQVRNQHFGYRLIKQLKLLIHSIFFVLQRAEALRLPSIFCGCSNSSYNTSRSLFLVRILYNLQTFFLCCKTFLPSFLPTYSRSGRYRDIFLRHCSYSEQIRRVSMFLCTFRLYTGFLFVLTVILLYLSHSLTLSFFFYYILVLGLCQVLLYYIISELTKKEAYKNPPLKNLKTSLTNLKNQVK